MKQATTKALYHYWNAVRGERLAPRRYEIEPSQIVPFLSETIILEQPASDASRIRVAGTKVCEWLGNDLRGQLFLELWSEEDQLVLNDNLHAIVEHGAVGLFRFEAALHDGVTRKMQNAEFEMLLLPLTHLEERIERVLGSISVVREPSWLAAELPTRLMLRANDIIWPDGRPFGLVQSTRRSRRDADSTPALRSEIGHAGMRRARLVRSDRRSFLVYDGGRTDTAETRLGARLPPEGEPR